MPFSVLLSVYLKENPYFLEQSLLSVFNQTLKPTEVVLVEDGDLTSELYSVIAKFPKLKIVKLPTNRGLGIALSEGLKQCSYNIVARMDTDDIAKPNRFEKQINYLAQHPNVDILGGQIEEFCYSVDNIVGKRVVPINNEEIKCYLKKRCPMNHMSIMFKKNFVISVGNYQDWHFNEDYYLYCRMLMNGAIFHNLSDTLVLVRVGDDMYRRRGGWNYFASEAKLQFWMFNHKIISLPRYCVNVLVRLIVQVLMPNWMRGFIFQKLFRR